MGTALFQLDSVTYNTSVIVHVKQNKGNKMEANDQGGQELQSLSSTRFLYNPQADSVRSIPATIIRNDTTKEPNWKFMMMNIFITIVVSLSVCLIFDYSKQSNQKSEETLKSEIVDSIHCLFREGFRQIFWQSHKICIF